MIGLRPRSADEPQGTPAWHTRRSRFTMNPSRIGPFAIEERLGSDGTSAVHRAVHIQQRRGVAVKLFAAPLISSDLQAKTALVQEVDRLKGLVHPNIARCYGGILEASLGCIASELVAGETLVDVLSRRGRLSWETVVDYAFQISSALDQAHADGVVHQDLTPDKILITDDDQVKIVDFRVDRANNPTCISSHKRTPQRARYLSPEQLRGDSPLTEKTDLYSLGCIMFEMLVGRPAFAAGSVEQITTEQLQTEPPRVGSMVLDCPIWLESLIRQLLEKDPANRPHGAAAVVLALQETHRQVAAKTGVLEHAAGGFSPLSREVDKDMARDLLRKARREKHQRERPTATPLYESPWFLALMLLLLVGGVAAWLLRPVNEAKQLERAKAILAEHEGVQQEKARPILERVLARTPQGEYAGEARVLIDELDMASAERRLRIRARLGQEPKSEAERHFAEAFRFEQFGDRLTALNRYQSMVDLFAEHGEDRPFVNLARRQIAALEKDRSPEGRVRFVEERLADAEQLAVEGRLVEARKIWSSIVSLYGSNREFEVQVERAQLQLTGSRPSPAEP